MTDELGRQTLYEIDPNNGNTLSVTQVIGEVGGTDDLITRFTYTSQGLVDKITDPLGRITNNDYNALGRLTKITFAVGTVDEASQQFEYDRAGNQTAIIDENGHRTQFTYDALNRLTRITEADPDGNGPLTSPVTTYTYDAAGNLIKTTDPLNQNTQNQYDVMNRLIKTIDSLNQITTFSYDQAGNLSSVIDQLGHITQNRYDTRNRLVETVDPENGITKLTYDLDDNLTSVTDPVNNKTTFSYDARDRLTRETDSLNKATQYQYDAVNNLIVKVDRNNRRTEFEYDDINRLISETWVGTDQEINYSYDKVSNLTAVTDKYSSLSYTYDNRDRTLTVDNTGTPNAPHVVLSYTYDAVGNMLSTTDTINGVVSGTNNYSYDALNRLTKLIQGGNGVSDKRVDFAYNAIGQYTSVSRYADLSGTDLVNRSTYSYDVLNRLTNLAHSNGTNNVAFYNYTYDAASRITQIVDIDGVTDYTYDNRNQLTATDSSNAIKPDESYSYDANGNRTNTGYQTGANNRLTSDGIYNYEYDNEGNLIKQTEIATNEVREFQWDYHNRLVSVSDLNASGVATQSVAFTYDAFDRRIAKEVDTTPLDNNDGTVTHFVYNGDDVHLDFVSSGSQPVLEQRYLYRAGVDQILAQEDGSGNVAWMLTDHLGTVRDLVSETGNLANHLVYDSFGRLISESAPSVDTRYLYTGREFDEEIDLQYNRARYYDASTGRFISEDPIGFLSEDVNLYRYVFNKPSGFTDPQGTIAAPVAFGVGFVIGFGIGYYLIPPALDFYQNYKDMRDANWKNSDKYFHCKANCQAAQKGSVGSLVSEVISELREWSDEKIKGDPPEACNADRAANDYGREEGKKNPDKSCKDVCQQYRPNGLPAKY
jgi:RHS repeat-associated protein